MSDLLFSITLPLGAPLGQGTTLQVAVIPDRPNELRLSLIPVGTDSGSGLYVDLPRFITAGLMQLLADLLNAPQRHPIVWRPGGDL